MLAHVLCALFQGQQAGLCLFCFLMYLGCFLSHIGWVGLRVTSARVLALREMARTSVVNAPGFELEYSPSRTPTGYRYNVV